MEREPRMKGGGGGEGMKWLQTNPRILKIPPPVNRVPDWLGYSNIIDKCRSMFCFKILIGHYAHINFLPLVFILEHFLWPLLECNPLLEIKGFRLFNFFLQSASWIWITKQNFLLSENAMVSCNVLSCWAQLISVFLRDGKFSPIVIYGSKFLRIDWP